MLDDGAHKILKLGKTAETSNRWAAAGDSTEAFSISSYAADWVTADVEKYQKPDEKKDKKDKSASSPPPDMGSMGGPPGMHGPPGMGGPH